MKRMFIRLDDACPKRNIDNWNRMESLLDKYGIKPLVGLIPNCKDPDMEKYPTEPDFWVTVITRWKEKGWVFALHGYEHVFRTNDGGINPVNRKSEFAGIPLQGQKAMIRNGLMMLKEHNIEVEVFFAPAHTFDNNTIKALKEESNIRIISDTIASDIYSVDGFTFVPQQSGQVRKLPFRTITFCYHPNTMRDEDFRKLEEFISMNSFSDFIIEKSFRKRTLTDLLYRKVYFIKRSFRR